KAETTNPVTGNAEIDYGHGWFEIRNFYFHAWSKNWEISTKQDIDFNVDLMDFEGNDVTATVSIDKVFYMGTRDSWQSPVVVNDSVGVSKSISGKDTITIPSGTISKEGEYSVVLKAVSGSNTETTEAWFYARPFTLFVNDATNNWDRRYGKTDTVNLTINGYENMDWSTWPPTGDGHNISSSWVQSVEKMGMWGTKYKTKDALLLNNNMLTTCDGNTDSCYLNFNLSGFEQGEYSLVIAANDSTGSVAESWFWLRVETLSINVPELMNWMKAQEKHTMTNKTRFKLGESCGSDSDTPIEPNNITNCKYGNIEILRMNSPNNYNDYYNSTYFLLEKENATLYVNASDVANYWEGINFTGVALGVNDTFIDGEGNNWTIVDLDTASNTIYLEATDGIIAYNPWSWNDEENKYWDTYLFTVDSSLSKSGKFLRADDLQDNEWQNIDLDNDGTMYWNETYHIILADTNQSGVYDKVYISNNTDFTNAIDATSGAPINFSSSSDVESIYLLKTKYHSGSSGNTNYYQLVFTSNNAGWPGRDMGIYKPGSILKLPVIVTEPSNKSQGIENATVRVKTLTQYGYTGEKNIPVVSTDVNTTSTGFAMVEVNLSGVQNGDYFVKIEVEYNGENTTTSTMWDNPRVSIRNFVVRGDIGMKGDMSGITKWVIDEYMTDEVHEISMSDMGCWWNGTNNCADINNTVLSVNWPYYNKVFYNSSSGMVIVDS
ncbi:MAG: hypothetical protein KAS12_05630, partial [Candidatus Aenigmarchaeota archaeon]|nr:hypothetical protein [Candidatus Aenigmarchaeota archaeon]